MLYLKNFLYLFLLFFSLQVKSQTESKEIKKLYHYTFEGVLAPENIQVFEQKLSQLPFVINAKVKYKSKVQKGELFLETSEKPITHEGEKGFETTEIDALFHTFNLIPTEFITSNR